MCSRVLQTVADDPLLEVSASYLFRESEHWASPPTIQTFSASEANSRTTRSGSRKSRSRVLKRHEVIASDGRVVSSLNTNNLTLGLVLAPCAKPPAITRIDVFKRFHDRPDAIHVFG
jgi:hypothetical protein